MESTKKKTGVTGDDMEQPGPQGRLRSPDKKQNQPRLRGAASDSCVVAIASPSSAANQWARRNAPRTPSHRVQYWLSSHYSRTTAGFKVHKVGGGWAGRRMCPRGTPCRGWVGEMTQKSLREMVSKQSWDNSELLFAKA